MKDSDKTAVREKSVKSDDEASIDEEIDIHLYRDLADSNSPSESSIYKDADLDIDLTGPFGENGVFEEPSVLNINPVTSFSCQVELNLGRLHRDGYLSPEYPNTELSTTFRGIKRPLLNNALGKGATKAENANLIMITSSVEGEGKTFTAINLALSMAMEKDKKVLLVDADANKPSHHEIFGLRNETGLVDYLNGKVADVSRIINRTNIPSLSVMFAGSRTSHAIELFASEATGEFLVELAKRYEDRVIVFDSAPLLQPTEASVLAPYMGQVVVVVEAESTSQEMVKKSVDMLDNSIVLLVLNKSRQESDYGGYGYYGHKDQ